MTKVITAQLLREGKIVYSPIASSHDLTIQFELPGEWQFWREYDRAMIAGASRFVVLKLDGWDQSVGVAAEIEIAREFGLEIEYMEVE